MQAGHSKQQIHSRINDLADSFEDAWLRGERPYLGEFWDTHLQGNAKDQLFAALLDLELHYTSERQLAICYDRLVSDFSDYQGLIETAWHSQQAHTFQTVHAPSSGSTPAQLAQLLTEGQSFGRYRILKNIGCGAMGVVFLAQDTLLERQVAIKIPTQSPTERSVMERLMREASVVSQLHHPNICPVFDIGCQDGLHYISMAFISGQTLAERIKQQPALSNIEIANLVRAIALALQEVHAIGVIHRDLKPANIMINEAGQPAVTDFGLARRMLSTSEISVTHDNMVLGSPAYMSPEQVCDAKNVGPSADIYSLGVILYQLLCDRLPFQGTIVNVLHSITNTEPDPPSSFNHDVNKKLEAICLKAMSKSPLDRFASMQEFAAAIDNYLLNADLVPNSISQLKDRGATPSPNASHDALTHPSAASRTNSSRDSRRTLLVALCCLPVLIFLGVVIFIPSKHGTLVVEIDDPTISVLVNSSGVVIQGEGNRPVSIVAGEEQSLTISVDERTYSTDKFTLQRGEKTVVRISFAKEQIVAKKDGEVWQVFNAPTIPGDATDSRPTNITLDTDQALLDNLATRGLRIHTESEIRVEEWLAKVEQVSWINLLEVQQIDRDELKSLLRIFPNADRILTNTSAIQIEDWSLIQRYDPSELMIASENIPGPILDRIGEMRRLAALGILSCNITDQQLGSLAQLEHLEYLGLDHNPLDGTGLKHLLRLKKLCNLDLAATNITDASLKHLAPFTELSALNLAHTQIDGSGFSVFQYCPELRSLDLSNTPIGPSSLELLATLPNLRHLSIRECSELTDLSALSNSQLTRIDVRGLPTTDLTPLINLPLETIWVNDPSILPAELLKNRPQLSVQ